MDWINLLLFILLVAGHTEFWVACVNRVYSRPWGKRVLRQFRHVHDVMVPLFPVLLFWQLGFSGPRLLQGGEWLQVSPGWLAYLSICTAGTIGLVVTSVYRQLRPVPAVQVAHRVRCVDVAERLGFRPLGDGPLRCLTGVPGNQVFEIELSHKRFELPQLPAAWDGLSILHLSDLHFTGTVDRPYFGQVIELAAASQPDLIVFTGDLLDDPRLVQWLPATLGRLHAPLGCFFILGNHDWELDPDEIRWSLNELGWTDVAGRCLAVSEPRGTLLIGGTERPWMGRHPDFETPIRLRRGAFQSNVTHNSIDNSDDGVSDSARLAADEPEKLPGSLDGNHTEAFENAAADQSTWTAQGPNTGRSTLRILLSHTPDNLPWAKRHGVDVMLSGHNHGGQVVLPLIGPVYSPSRYGCRYASGTFWEQNTLLHVSRGVSAHHPLRLWCLPEVTTLEFTGRRHA